MFVGVILRFDLSTSDSTSPTYKEQKKLEDERAAVVVSSWEGEPSNRPHVESFSLHPFLEYDTEPNLSNVKQKIGGRIA